MINVTKTFLPPQKDYQAILKRAWKKGWITNRGILVQELEDKLKAYLKVPHILATTNGTLPLQIAIKALGLKGEIITTAFSYVATTSGIVWEGCTPVFVDIHPEYLTIDETKIEDAITPKTSAILATHIFGNPCAIEAIDDIAKKHNLKIIYDAAHCFGVTYKGQSVFNFGDISTCSFHATKLFHTGEGGALFTKDTNLYDILFYHHNFGHKGNDAFHGLGINAKMSELQAAMGLSVLPYMDTILKAREKIVKVYNNAFKNSNLQSLKIREGVQWNYSYYPIIFKDETQLLKAQKALNKHDIYPRRYFFPALHTLPYVNSTYCPVVEKIAPTVLCLPLYYGLPIKDVEQIASIILEHL